ncbi:TPA: NAD(P)-binding protein, partial [Enterobacter cloacae]|nr:NAD(P)-binding protein [Enterobacter cloacae]
MYDYIIVGSGLFGSVCAHELHKMNYKVLVLEKREHIGGNIYTENNKGIHIHKYGAHIFHT